MSTLKKISIFLIVIFLFAGIAYGQKKFRDYTQQTTPNSADALLLSTASSGGTKYILLEDLFDLIDVIAAESFEDDDWGDMSVSSNSVTIDEDVLDKANFKDEDWGDMSVATNSVTIDADVLDKANFKDEDWGDLSVASNVVSIDADAVKDEHIDWTDVTSTDMTFDADTVPTTAVYSGTTSLEETTAANDSGASIIGVFAEFDNSISVNVQDVLDDLDAAITAAGGGDITAVGPGFATGGAFTDGVVSAGTTMLIWEGTTSDTFELNLISPSANPTADINITFPSATGTLLTADGVGTSLTALNGESLQDDSVDDDSIDFTDITLNDFTFDVGSVDKTEYGYLDGVTSALQTQLDAKQALDSTLTDIADGTIAENLVNTTNPWADNEVADTLTVTAQAGSTWGIADSVAVASVYSGTTSLEESTSATDSGAYIIGVFDEFTNSDAITIQGVLNDLDAAIIPGGGDITTVGTCTSGECETDFIDDTDIADDAIKDEHIDWADVTCADITTTDCGAIAGTSLAISGKGTFGTGTGASGIELTGTDPDYVLQSHAKITTDLASGAYSSTYISNTVTANQNPNTSIFADWAELYITGDLTLSGGNYAAMWGNLELTDGGGSLTLSNDTVWMAGVVGTMISPDGLVIGTGWDVAGVLSDSSLTAGYTNNGTLSAFAARVSSGKAAWPVGYRVLPGAATLDFVGQNGESINNATDGTWDFGAANLLTTGNIELGHATDTTIARASAGEITVEGVAVYLAGDEDTIAAAITQGALANDSVIDDDIDLTALTLADLTFDVGSVDTTEFGYLNGVTSAIQTQINTKATGPGTSTDHAIARWDSTGGYTLLNSGVTVDDSNNMVVPGTLTAGTSTFTISGSNGIVTISGNGDGQDEDMVFDLNTTPNTVGIGTTQGVTGWNFGAIGIATTGLTTGGVKSVVDADGGEVDAYCYGGVWFASGTGTLLLPAVAVGMQITVENHTALDVLIDPDGTEVLRLNGTALGAGVAITGTDLGDGCVLTYYSAGVWSAFCSGYE